MLTSDLKIQDFCIILLLKVPMMALISFLACAISSACLLLVPGFQPFKKLQVINFMNLCILQKTFCLSHIILRIY